MRVSDKMDSHNIKTASQILHNNTRAPHNLQTMAEVSALLAVDVDADETTQIQRQCATIKQAAKKCAPPQAQVGKANGQRSRADGRTGPQGMEECRKRTLGRKTCCVTRQSSSGRRRPSLHSAVDRRHRTLGSRCLRHATQAGTDCACGGVNESDRHWCGRATLWRNLAHG